MTIAKCNLFPIQELRYRITSRMRSPVLRRLEALGYCGWVYHAFKLNLLLPKLLLETVLGYERPAESIKDPAGRISYVHGGNQNRGQVKDDKNKTRPGNHITNP